MTKNAIAVCVGTVCSLLFCSMPSSGQSLSGSSLSVSGTSTLNVLDVTGVADFQNNTLFFGTSGTTCALSVLYNDVTPSITVQSTRSSSVWNWQRLMASGSAVTAMQLDASNRLVLTGTTATNPPQLVLDPNGTSTINGNAILTQSYADSLYLSANAGLFTSNGNFGIGTSASNARLQINVSSSGSVGEIIKGATSQTADLLQIQDATGVTNLKINQAGHINIGANTSDQSGSVNIAETSVQANNPGASLGSIKFWGASRQKPSAIIEAQQKAWDDSGCLVFKASAGSPGATEVARMSLASGTGQLMVSCTSASDALSVGGGVYATGNANFGGNANFTGNLSTSGVLVVQPTSSGNANSRNSAQFSRNPDNYISITQPGHNTAGFGLTSTGQFIVCNQSTAGGIHFKTGIIYNGDWELSGSDSLSVVSSKVQFFTDKVTVLSSGTVGIGTTTPRALLDVNGNTYIAGGLAISGTGSLTLPDGTIITGSENLRNIMTSGTALMVSGTQIYGLAAVAITGDYNSLTGRPTIPTDVAQLANSTGYITSSGTVGCALVAAALSGTIPAAQISSLAPVATGGNLDYSKINGAPTTLSSFSNDVGYIGSGGTGNNVSFSGTTRIQGGFIVTGTMSGNVVVAGTNQVVLIPQQGDLSMGDFTAGTKPQ